MTATTAESSRRSRQRVLIMNPSPIRPDMASGDRRLAQIIEFLASRHRCDARMFKLSRSTDAHPWIANAVRQSGGQIQGDDWLRENHSWIAREFSVVLMEFWWGAKPHLQPIRKRQPWAWCIVDTVDVHYLREQTAVQLGLLPAQAMAQTKAQELAVYRASDAIIVVTLDERAALIHEGITAPIFIVPTFAPIQERTKKERQREVLFVGGFGHAPNIDAVLWFVRECWPLIRANVPDAIFTIVGSKAPPQILALNGEPGVQVIGYVEQTAPYLDRAAVSIAPLRVGGGMKGKVCEALGAGIPLITTPIGAQGIPLRHRESACVAESSAAFADEVIWALTHVEAAQSMGSRGRQVIADLCGPDTVARYLDPLSQFIAALPKRYPLRRLWWQLFWSGGVLPAVRLWNRIGPKSGAAEVCGDG